MDKSELIATLRGKLAKAENENIELKSMNNLFFWVSVWALALTVFTWIVTS